MLRSMIRLVRRSQRGFTLIELLAVMSILGVLTGIVAAGVGGVGTKSTDARLEGDINSIGTAADRFFTDNFPQKYPVVNPDTNGDSLFTTADSPPLPAGDVGVREIDFDADLTQDPTKDFVPDYLKEIPDSAGQVSWRIDTNTGLVFPTDYGASLIQPSESRLNVSATATVGAETGAIAGTVVESTVVSVSSAYTLDLTMKKNEAAQEIMEVEIPAGYSIGGGSVTTADMLLGELTATLGTDNTVEAGQTIVFGGVLLSTTSANTWKLMVDYSNNRSTSGAEDQTIRASVAVRVHPVTLIAPTTEKQGKLTFTMDRKTTDTDHNSATENWKLTIFAKATHTLATADFNTSAGITSGLAAGDVTLTATAPSTFTFDLATPTTNSTDVTLITNPSAKGVYRWLAKEQSTIDVTGVFTRVAGNQAVIITAS